MYQNRGTALARRLLFGDIEARLKWNMDISKLVYATRPIIWPSQMPSERVTMVVTSICPVKRACNEAHSACGWHRHVEKKTSRLTACFVIESRSELIGIYRQTAFLSVPSNKQKQTSTLYDPHFDNSAIPVSHLQRALTALDSIALHCLSDPATGQASGSLTLSSRTLPSSTVIVSPVPISERT